MNGDYCDVFRSPCLDILVAAHQRCHFNRNRLCMGCDGHCAVVREEEVKILQKRKAMSFVRPQRWRNNRRAQR